MKNLFTVLLACLSFILITSCSNKDTDTPTPTPTIPDATFTMSVSGAESHSFNFTLPGNVATTHALGGSLITSLGMFAMQASPLPNTSWSYGLQADMPSMTNGVYN